MQGTPTTVTSTQQTGPPQFQQPFIDQLFSAAQQRFEGPGPSFFPGSTVAGFDPAQVQAQQQVEGTAVPQSQALVNQMAATSGDILGGKFLDPNSDPNLARSIEASRRPIQQTLTEGVLPNIRSGATATRSIGGSRQGIAEGIAARGALDATGDAASNILAQNRLAGMDQITKTLALAPQTASATGIPASLLDAVGTQRRQLEQSKIDEAIQRHNFEQTLPDQQLAQFASIVGRPFGSATTSVGPGPTAPSIFQGIMGGASTGASVGSAAGPYGAIIGAVVGGVAGGASASNPDTEFGATPVN